MQLQETENTGTLTASLGWISIEDKLQLTDTDALQARDSGSQQ